MTKPLLLPAGASALELNADAAGRSAARRTVPPRRPRSGRIRARRLPSSANRRPALAGQVEERRANNRGHCPDPLFPQSQQTVQLHVQVLNPPLFKMTWLASAGSIPQFGPTRLSSRLSDRKSSQNNRNLVLNAAQLSLSTDIFVQHFTAIIDSYEEYPLRQTKPYVKR